MGSGSEICRVHNVDKRRKKEGEASEEMEGKVLGDLFTWLTFVVLIFSFFSPFCFVLMPRFKVMSS